MCRIIPKCTKGILETFVKRPGLLSLYSSKSIVWLIILQMMSSEIRKKKRGWYTGLGFDIDTMNNQSPFGVSNVKWLNF